MQLTLVHQQNCTKESIVCQHWDLTYVAIEQYHSSEIVNAVMLLV